MSNEEPVLSVFDRTGDSYIEQVLKIIPTLSEDRLGIMVSGEEVTVPLLNRIFHISKKGVIDSSGKKASFYFSVVLLKYLLTERDEYSDNSVWCSFRDFKDSAPLISFFKTSIEDVFINEYSGDITRLRNACISIGGTEPQGNYSHDISMRFMLLPKIPVLLLFNDEDEEFPASCSVLFEQRAERFLDAECLAMSGKILFDFIIEAAVLI